MRNIFNIFEREIKSYFTTPIAYVVLMIFLAISGYFFYSFLMEFNIIFNRYQYFSQMSGNPAMLEMLNLNELVIERLLQNTLVILVFLMPILMMKSFAEEKKSGTYEILMTSPVTHWQIIIAKFLSSFTLILALLAPTFIYVIMVYSWGKPEMGPVFTGYLGLLLFAGAGIAIGLFASSLTSDQIVAGVVTFVILLFLIIIGYVGQMSDTLPGRIASYISINDHFPNLTRGLVLSSDIMYFLSLIALFLFLTKRSIESIMWR